MYLSLQSLVTEELLMSVIFTVPPSHVHIQDLELPQDMLEAQETHIFFHFHDSEISK